jgi:hypothetical protein
MKFITVIVFGIGLQSLLPTISRAVDKEQSVEEVKSTHYRYTNRLINESSPYLLSHAHNPVDWYPWGDEALNKAKAEDKPIFLSIGYAACHWCHVMERESFENEEIAAVLNEYFVSIKVDREQRPDLDEIYMAFTTAMTGGGGWPMSVFLTPDLKPFFAGTYFPPYDKYGRPGFLRVIKNIAQAYREDKAAITASADNIFQQVNARIYSNLPAAVLHKDMISQAAQALMNGFDHVYGGFGNAPKFPHALELSLFLRRYQATGDQSYLNAAEQALKAMARGGIYDHIGGGFARYSTDRQWLVPHFEKMLYDNALLVPVYVEAYQITQNGFYRRIVRETLDFLLNEMTDGTGGFYSSLDADSEGEEGKFYLWTKREIDSVLGRESELFTRYYNVTARGNFEGKNILHINSASDRIRKETGDAKLDRYLSESRQKLYQARSLRVRPLTDDKILTSWNGLALTAFCKGYQITRDKRYLAAAVKNASFIHAELYHDHKLTHAYRAGKHTEGEFLEDYAFLIRGLLDLYETDIDNNQKWLQFATELAKRAIDAFLDSEGRFYLRPDSQSDLIMRPQEEIDGAIPAPGSIMIADLLKLNRLTGDEHFLQTAEKALQAISGKIENYPSGMTSAVLALDYFLNDKIEIVLVGQGQQRDAMLQEVYRRFIPNKVIAVSADGDTSLPLFEGRHLPDGKVSAFVCRNSVCALPATNLEEFKRQLDGLSMIDVQ